MLDKDPIKIRDEISNLVKNHDYTQGPLLLLAGPGTGKTYSLLETINTQLDKGLEHSDFFEATLTNAAADDFIVDAKKQITPVFDSSSTLHSLAKGILHQNAILLGLNPNFTVLDEKYEEFILADICHILEYSNSDINKDLKKYKKALAKYLIIKSDFTRIYQKIQLFYSAIDWFNVVKLACELLENHREVRVAECNKFNFLLIDEYQDLNPAEQRFVELLLNGRTNLLVVGDDDQSIYSFRYADPHGLTTFNLRYPKAHKQVLPVTTRLPSKVIDASYSLISENKTHDRTKAKILPLYETDKRADYGFVISVNLKSGKAEREFIGKAINNLLNGSNTVSPIQILVLCNCTALGIELIKTIQNSEFNIPIQNDLEKTESQDTNNLLFGHLCKFVSNHEDNLSLRIILDKLLGANSDDPSFIVKYSLRETTSLWQTIKTHKVISQLEGSGDIVKNFVRVVQESIRFVSFKDQLNYILSEISPLSDLFGLLENKDQQSPNISSDEEVIDKVRFITLHSSKGLDADFVFIPFMEESIDLNPTDIEEKRRLLYVAITRAKVGVIFSWAWSRHTDKRYKCAGRGRGPDRDRKPSPFIKECGINPTLRYASAKPSSSEVALQILSKHAACVYSFDNA